VSDPYIGEIRLMSFNFPPKGWAFCNGQLLPINQNQALFSILGTTYGGNGTTTFALPNLQGRVPIHEGGGHSLGEAAGEFSHTLSTGELPAHSHSLVASGAAATTGLTDPSLMLATSVGAAAYGPPAQLVAMAPDSLTSVGGSQPHQNTQPFLVISFCIAIVGIFPSRN
jgi:microcystin-dependent protein